MPNPAEFKITRAGVADVADAIALLHEYYESIGVIHRDAESAIRTFLAGEDAGMWIAFKGADPIGCVVLRKLVTEEPAVECKRLFVRAEYRRRGVAAALMDAVESFARQSGARWLYLDSKDDLDAAIALYTSRGYQPCGRYNDNTQATVFLRKRLGP